MDIEDPEVSFERYHDRYMATLRGQYEAGRMGGEARALRKLKEQSEAIQEKDRILAEKDREIEEIDRKIAESDREIQELKARIREMLESMKGNA
jgi:predicted transcriptional regulator